MSDARSYTDRCGKTMRKKAQAVVIKIRIGEGSTQSSSGNSLCRADESESTCKRSAQCHHGQRRLLLARTSWTTAVYSFYLLYSRLVNTPVYTSFYLYSHQAASSGSIPRRPRRSWYARYFRTSTSRHTTVIAPRGMYRIADPTTFAIAACPTSIEDGELCASRASLRGRRPRWRVPCRGACRSISAIHPTPESLSVSLLFLLDCNTGSPLAAVVLWCPGLGVVWDLYCGERTKVKVAEALSYASNSRRRCTGMRGVRRHRLRGM